MAGTALHGDDTPVPVLAPGTGKTKTGRLWVYLRDERPCTGPAPPAVLYRYSADRKGEHPRRHLARFHGFLHAERSAGFGGVYQAEDGRPAAVTEVFCWAHVRRRSHDLHLAGSPLAKEALDRIGHLFDVERAISGMPPEMRQRIRQSRTVPLVEELAAFLDATLPKLSGKSELAGAIRYARSRWPALTRYLANGRLEISNNAAERAIRPLATRRSLCPSSSSLWKHWKLVLRHGATRASCSANRVGYPFVLQVGGSDLVRSTRHNLLGGENTVPDQLADAMVCDPEPRSGLGHCQPFATLLGGAVGVDAVHPAHRADTVRGPGLSLTRRHSHSVERGGDIRVRPAGRHAPHHRERRIGRAAPVLAGFRLADAQV